MPVRPVPCVRYSFSMQRTLAQEERLLVLSSSSDAVMGFRVRTLAVGFLPQTHTGALFGQVQGCSNVRNAFLTMRSSSE